MRLLCRCFCKTVRDSSWFFYYSLPSTHLSTKKAEITQQDGCRRHPRTPINTSLQAYNSTKEKQNNSALSSDAVCVCARACVSVSLYCCYQAGWQWCADKAVLAVLQACCTQGLKRRHCNITEMSTTSHIRLIYNISSYLGGSLQVEVNRVYMHAKHVPRHRFLGRRKFPLDVISSAS